MKKIALQTGGVLKEELVGPHQGEGGSVLRSKLVQAHSFSFHSQLVVVVVVVVVVKSIKRHQALFVFDPCLATPFAQRAGGSVTLVVPPHSVKIVVNEFGGTGRRKVARLRIQPPAAGIAGKK